MSQQNIDFGSFPDDPNADAIRTAFQKVQENFDEIYAAATVGTVTSVNGGAGITVNSPSGNVVVTSRISNVILNTSTLRMGSTPANSSLTASISNSSSQQITIDIDPANVFSANFSGVSGALANITGTLTSNSNSQPNITSIGTLANLSVTGNANVGNIGATGVFATTLGGALTTASQPNVTSVGNLTSLNVSGNIRSSAYIGGNVSTTGANAIFVGDGGLLSNLTISAGSSIVNGNSNVSIIANGNVTTSVAGVADIFTVTSTGANVSGYLTASGNITSTNANLGNAVNANYFIGNLYGIANSATTAGTVTTNAQPNITSVGTLSSVTVTADVTAGNVYANSGIVKGQYLYGDGSNITNITITAGSSIVNGTSNVSIPSSGGNVNTVVAGNTTLVVTGTGVNIAGNLNATGTITGNFNGNVTNATQGNITSLGALTGLTVNGVSNLGPVGNVTITGGTSGYYLQTNGSGGLSWTNALLTPIPGSNTQVLFNDAGAANANSSLTFNKTTGALTATLLGGTLTTNAQPNITSVGSLTSLIVNGNINTANASVTGVLIVTANITTPQFISNVATGTAPLVVTSTTQVANLNVANAGLATFATTANAVAGANVSGAVSFATTANAVAGANVSGAVSFATTANSVAGGNVSGTVSSATSATTAGTVTTAAQPNITSVGTLTSLNSSGNITAPSHIANTGYFIRSVSASVSAAGSTQGTGTALTTEFNRVSTVSSGQGVVLPTATAGMAIVIVNTSANSLLVYPATGAVINSLSTNVGYSHVTLATLQYIAISSTQWYTVGASYA